MKNIKYRKVQREDGEGKLIDMIEVTTVKTRIIYISITELNKKKAEIDKALLANE